MTNERGHAHPPEAPEADRTGRRHFLRDAVGYAAQTAGSLSGLIRGLDAMTSAARTALEPGTGEAGPEAVDPRLAFAWTNNLDPPYRVEPWRIELVDRRRLPAERWLELADGPAVAAAIADGLVAGLSTLPPLAAHAMALAARDARDRPDWAWRGTVEGTASALTNAAPEARGVRWAVRRMLEVAAATRRVGSDARVARMAVETCRIEREVRRDIGLVSRLAVSERTEGRESLGILLLGDPGPEVAHVLARITTRASVIAWIAEHSDAPWESSIATARLAGAGVASELAPIGQLVAAAPRGSIDALLLLPRAVEPDGQLACAPGSRSQVALAAAYGIPVIALVPTWIVAGEESDAVSGATAPRLFVGQEPRAELVERSLVSSVVTERGILRGSDAAGLRVVADRRAAARLRLWRSEAVA